ncbi:fimbrial biogenesis outer membrane usher protein [Yersinia sp. KBS0713]|uniref:fimbria/pilus outer membrane usher protein n=1 Tax=Yersinia TaxID=629 RepID=UPI00110F5667|nr:MULTISPECIES: fimbria/pilus outer membrane usher protein [Yersinia]QDW31697.1 fimbrial biogenesis outer membrane usher protein [Yersinia sp. KBS0713]
MKINRVLPSLCLFGSIVHAQNDIHFNPAFLNGESDSVADLSWVNDGRELPVGEYNVSIYVNEDYLFTGNVKFSINNKKGNSLLEPCLTLDQMKSMLIDVTQAQVDLSLSDEQCYFLGDYFPDTEFSFDQNKLSLYFNLPQRYMLNVPRGYINPKSWEYGISSAWLNYVVNGSRNEYHHETREIDNQMFIGLNSGVNFGPWRFRDYSTWTKNTDDGLMHVQTWVQRDLPALQSQLYLGETHTSAQIFGSVGLRGVAMNTDDNMLPTSLSGYAPEVRGIARSNATVTVRQNGNIIYQTPVSPGEFVLNDLYPTSSGGDLSVTIQEANGSETYYTVPFASVPNLVRPGQFKYATGVGYFRSNENQDSPLIMQTEVFWGWEYGLTLYGGAQFSENYTGLAMGIGQNVGRLGAYSMDVIHAQSVLADRNSYSGDALRLRYNKSLNDYGTRINLNSWFFSSDGFYELSDTTYKRMQGGNVDFIKEADGSISTNYENVYDLALSRKSRNQVVLSQSMGDAGALSLSWDKQTYWKSDKSVESAQFAWNNTFGRVALGASYQRSTSLHDSKIDNIFSLSLSLPLGDPALSTRANYALTNSDSSGSISNVGLNGYVPGQENLFYSANQRYSTQQQNGGDLALRYQGGRGDYNLGYGYSKSARNLSYGMSGGAVLHEDGLTLSQPLGNTNILIKAEGASDVAIRSHRGVKTDSRGYAVIPYATPYRVNRVEMDVTTAGDGVELDNTIISKTPTEGALVRATIPTKVGMKGMFFVRHKNDVLPFGTLVSLSGKGTNTGIVGDEGSLYLSGLPPQGMLRAAWGTGNDKTCTASYQLDQKYYNPKTGLYSQELVCQ